jgi:hypothetical protein
VKSFIFWDITSYRPLKFSRFLVGTCCLNLHALRIGHARNQHVEGSKQNNSIAESWGLNRQQDLSLPIGSLYFAACFRLVSCLTFSSILPKRLSTFNRLHGVIFHKRELFITTAVKLKLSFCLINLAPRHEGVWRNAGRVLLFLKCTLN